MNTDQHIRDQARESARELLREGWAWPGSEYSIGAYHGDVDALRERLGREPTRDELRALEERIRERLDEGRPDYIASRR